MGTVQDAIKTLRDLDGLIERLNLSRDDDPLSPTDCNMILEILHQVYDNVLKSGAYIPVYTSEIDAGCAACDVT